MYALYAFGSMVERTMGSRRFTYLYLASVLTGSLVQLVVVTMALDQRITPTIGASGGVFGVLLAFAALFPHARVLLVIPPIPMKAGFSWLLMWPSNYSVACSAPARAWRILPISAEC